MRINVNIKHDPRLKPCTMVVSTDVYNELVDMEAGTLTRQDTNGANVASNKQSATQTSKE